MKKLIILGVGLVIIFASAYILKPYAFGYTENIEVKKEVCVKPQDSIVLDSFKPIDLSIPKLDTIK
jgi:hypothetical protein